MLDLSVVIPVYRGEKTLIELVSRLENTLVELVTSFELILIEDASPDDSWSVMKQLSEQHKFVRSIKLSRNFGQHYAITAGLHHVKGEKIVVMDCDLQDVPEEISKMYKKAQEGFDIVFGQRIQRQDSTAKKLSSKVFYSVFGYLTGTKQDPSIANFGVYDRKVIDAIISMGDKVRYFPTMVQWVGFNSAKMEIAHAERFDGKSSYSWSRLLQLALDNVVAFSDKPLRILVNIGFVLSFTSFLVGIYFLFMYLDGKVLVDGFTSIILTLSFLFGLIIITLGVIGIYLGKTFNQTKNRPNYIVAEILN